MTYKIIDFKTKAAVTPGDFVFTGAEGPWDVIMDLEETRSQINEDYFRAAPPQVSKYLPFLPVKDHSKFVSLKEGGTPLIRSKHIGPKLGIDLWFKLEPQNPTGSFKDRGSAVDLSVARELGAKAIVLASTGNMAASCACYAAAAHVPCFVFVPEGTPPSKLAQVIAYGGHIVQVKGQYNDCARIAEEVAHELGFYLAGDYAFRVEGQKTAAFEICDQLFYHAPDMVVVPIGCGTNLTGYGKGFKEYRELGFIDAAPRIIGVQAEGAAGVVNAFQERAADVTTLPGINTIASAIAVTYPLDGCKALAAIYDSQGTALTVSDQEMLEAQYELSGVEGLFVEVSSATTLAAIKRLALQEDLSRKKIVCVLTGNGLKDPLPLLKVALKPPTIYPDVREFLQLHDNAFFEGKSVAFFDQSKVLFAAEPDVAEVKRTAKRLFDARYSDAHLAIVQESIAKHLKKGKQVTFSDFQDIVQDALRTSETPHPEILLVENFEIFTAKDTPPTAWVVIRIAGDLQEGRAAGVGPVDAVISALQDAAKDHSMPFELTDYQVGIRSRGTDAVVEVELKLKREGEISVGTGVSPDIIQASIEAFCRAFNSFSVHPGDTRGERRQPKEHAGKKPLPHGTIAAFEHGRL